MGFDLSSFFQDDGRTIILPIDHGTAIPVPDMPEPAGLIEAVADYVDGFVVNAGVALACRQALEGKGVCLRTDVYKPDNPAGAFRVFGAEEAEAVGAQAMMQMMYPGHDNEALITVECAETIAEGLERDMPVIVEALPQGLGLPEAYTTEAVGFAVRQAAELGAAVVKTAWPNDATVASFAEVVARALVPVIVLGGAARGDDEALLTMVSNALQAGAAGIAIGRNVWQHPDPVRITQRLHAMVHRGASVAEALNLNL